MIILRNRLFTSKYEDEDYLEDLKKQKENNKGATLGDKVIGGSVGAFLGGTGGAAIGESIPEGTKLAKVLKYGLPIAGIAGGAAGGVYLTNKVGKKWKKEKDEKLMKEIERYENGNEEDRAYLRRKSGWEDSPSEHLVRIKREK
jgi:hypothetical protein